MAAQPVTVTVAVPRPLAPRGKSRLDPRILALPLAAILLGAAMGTGSVALLVLAALPAIAAVLLRPDGAVVIFAAGSYINFPVVIAAQAGLTPGLAGLFAAILALPFIGFVLMGRQPLVVTPALALMVGYLLALVLSGVLGAGAGPQTGGVIISFITEGLLLFLLLTNVIRTPGTLRLVIWAVAIVCGIMGAISLWQELTGSYSNHLLGFAQVSAGGFNVGSEATGETLRPRLAGPIGEKNRYAQVLLVMIPLGLYLLRTEKRRALRILGGVLSALAVCGVMLTFSRGAAVALIVMMLAMLVLGFIRLRYVVAMVLAVIGLALAVAPDYIERVGSLGSAESALSSDSTADAAVVGRATENLAAYHAFADHPIFGVGPEQYFRTYSQEYANRLNLRFLEENRRAHNLYLEMAADLGIVGVGMFLGIVGVTLLGLWRMNLLWRDRHPPHALMAVAMMVGIIGYMASGIFLQLSYQRYFFFLLALANATYWVLRREAQRTGVLR